MLVNDVENLILGIDGGGSKTKAIVVTKENEIIGSGLSGPGNPLHGFEQATHSIVESAKAALNSANIPESELKNMIAGVGLAGVNLPSLYQQIIAWQHPFKTMHLTTDLRIACLGAHEGKEGAIIISGTGSCGFLLSEHKEKILGGHGFPHGDIASGAWLGLEAVKYTLTSLDNLKPNSLLIEKVAEYYGVYSSIALVEKVANKPAAFYAKLANIVFDAAEQGDQCATIIIQQGSGYIEQIAQQITIDKSTRLSMLGGLAHRWLPWLEHEVKNRLTPPLSTPEFGAIYYARQQEALMIARENTG